jgi:hypothetical protein
MTIILAIILVNDRVLEFLLAGLILFLVWLRLGSVFKSQMKGSNSILFQDGRRIH